MSMKVTIILILCQFLRVLTSILNIRIIIKVAQLSLAFAGPLTHQPQIYITQDKLTKAKMFLTKWTPYSSKVINSSQ